MEPPQRGSGARRPGQLHYVGEAGQRRGQLPSDEQAQESHHITSPSELKEAAQHDLRPPCELLPGQRQPGRGATKHEEGEAELEQRRHATKRVISAFFFSTGET